MAQWLREGWHAPSIVDSLPHGPFADGVRVNRSRRTNGATQTFRRPSGATATTTPTTAQQHDGPAPRYVPPHRNGPLSDTRYTKDQMLDAYRVQQTVHGALSDGLSDLFVGGWHPDMTNGASAGWARNEHSRDNQPGPDVCWERDGMAEPLGLVDMDDDEREVRLNHIKVWAEASVPLTNTCAQVLHNLCQHAYKACKQGQSTVEWYAGTQN